MSPAAGPDAILAFWFGPADSPDYGKPRRQWFAKDADFDRIVAERFGALVDAALADALPDWSEAPTGLLAKILLLDQFTRNIHRGLARAFAGDAQALGAAQRLLSTGADQQLLPVERAFAYLPFEHAEDADMQALSVQLFDTLGRAHPALADYARHARRHREVILRFGRFPHRNTALGRQSTAAEERYLREPGSSF